MVHGFLSLVVLGQLMRKIAHSQDKKEDDVLPCKYFDVICGSGTGGYVMFLVLLHIEDFHYLRHSFIAILLGRLQMTVKDAQDTYCNILDNALKTLSGQNRPYDPRVLEEAIKEYLVKVIKGANPEDMKMVETGLSSKW